MVHSLRRLVVAASLGAVLFGAGCFGRGPSRVVPPSIDASAAGTAAIRQYDKDGDGKISGAELDSAPSLKAALAQIDANGDGAISADEITARIRQWQGSKVGRMPRPVTVLRRGQPLEGATVKLVPEEFLGGNMPVGSGTSNASGLVFPSAPTTGIDDPMEGMPPGFYRVEVTKDGEIPSQYNSDTTLGLEVALDAEGIQEGTVFNLNY
jgi:hypothetical protein